MELWPLDRDCRCRANYQLSGSTVIRAFGRTSQFEHDLQVAIDEQNVSIFEHIALRGDADYLALHAVSGA
jgi:hypothetical protein